jgi:hypothetical protein
MPRSRSAAPPQRSSRRPAALADISAVPQHGCPSSSLSMAPSARTAVRLSLSLHPVSRLARPSQRAVRLLHRNRPIAAFSTGAASSASPVSSTPVNFICRQASIPKHQGDMALKVRVANIYFRCFRGILQVFRISVAKVDRDVVHVAMAIHVCFKYMF